MPTQAVTGRIRLGILALPLSPALALAGDIVLGPLPDSPDDIRAYAEIAASTRYAVSNFLMSISALLGIFGVVALYAYLANGRAERWAFFAMVLCVPGLAAPFAYAVGTSGVQAVAAEQYLEGQQAVFEEWFDLLDWSTLFLLVTNAGLFSIGLVLFGVAIWRSQTLPQGAAILWLANVLFFFAIPLTWLALPISYLLITIAGGWIAWIVWLQPPARAAEAEAQPRVQ